MAFGGVLFVDIMVSYCIFFSISVQQPNLSHPFHLHGYSYNVIGIGRSPDSNINKINLKHALEWDRKGLLHRQFNHPPLKDTIAVPNNGYVIFRFRADNPGRCQLERLLMRNILNYFFISFIRILDVPLPLFVPHIYRNGLGIASRRSRRPTTSATKFPNMWGPQTSY